MQHRTWWPRWAASAHCWVVSSLSSTSPLKSFLAGLLSIRPSRSLCWYWGLHQLRCSTLVLLNWMRFPWAYFLSLSRFLWRGSSPSGLPTVSLQLANLLQVHLICLCNWWRDWIALIPVKAYPWRHHLMSIETLSHWHCPLDALSLFNKQSTQGNYPSPIWREGCGDSVKAFTEVQVHGICSPSLVHQCSHSIVEIIEYIRCWQCLQDGKMLPN